MSDATPQPIIFPDSGDIVNTRYRIEAKLGHGGMGLVFRATDLQNNEEVALKYLNVPPDKTTAIDRFKSEFAKLAKFPHPNISLVYDFGKDDARNVYFFTTELIRGKTFLEATRGRSPADVESLVVQTLRALAYLHNNRLVHFDIKPPNVLVTQDFDGRSVVKVIDFGVADYGFQGRLVGTPSYMAPEMCRKDIPDRRADLYSLGVMWYQSLAGLTDSPFRCINRDDTFEQHQTLTLPALHQVLPEIPEYMDRIVARLIAKSPEKRFACAEDVILEINMGKQDARDHHEVETRETRRSYIPDSARFVGRQQAIADIRSALATYTSPVWITGERGSGKSRLLGELQHLAQLNGFATVGATANDTASWDALRKAIERVREKPADPVVFWVDGYEDIPLKEELGALQDYIARMKNLDIDCHTCLVISGVQVDPALSQGGVHIDLHPFTEAELSDYVVSVTGFEKPPAGFVKELMRHTEGRPHFVTEVVRALIDNNMLLDSAGRWKATTFDDLGVDFSTIHVPETMSGSIALEFNKLSAPEQQSLSLLAVWNGPATLSQLEHVFGNPIDPTTPIRLLKMGWVDMDMATNAMTIPNPQRRMAVESLVGVSTREAWHLKIAEFLEHDDAADPEQLHWHYAHSRHPKRATESQCALAENYADTQRPLAAIDMLKKLIATPPLSSRHEARILLARTYRNIRRFANAASVLDALEKDLATEGHQHELHARVWEDLAITAIKQGNLDKAEAACMHGLKIQQRHSENPVLRIRTDNYLGQVFLARGAVDRAISIFRRTREEAAQLHASERIEITNNELCNALFQKGDYESVIRDGNNDLVFYEDAGKTRQYLLCNFLLANACRGLKRNQSARDYYLKGIEIARTQHDPEYLFHHYHGLASLYSDLGQHEDALVHFERAMDLAARLDDPVQLIATRTNMAALHVKLARTDAAERDFLAILDYMRQHPATKDLAKVYSCRAHLELGDIYVKQSRFGDACTHLDAAEDHVHKYANCAPLLFSVQLTRAEMHRDMGDKQSARQLLARLRKSAQSPEEIHQLDITETTFEDSD